MSCRKSTCYTNLPKHLRMFVLHVPLEIKLFKLCKSENRKFQVNSFEIVGFKNNYQEYFLIIIPAKA